MQGVMKAASLMGNSLLALMREMQAKPRSLLPVLPRGSLRPPGLRNSLPHGGEGGEVLTGALHSGFNLTPTETPPLEMHCLLTFVFF